MTVALTRPRFALYVHHTDAEREWAYDRLSKSWTIVNMKDDWKIVFPQEK